MAELTNMESKIGEVTGLAMAAKAATSTVKKLADESGDEQLIGLLDRMHRDATETEERCTALAGTLAGKKTAILEEARETKQKGAQMMEIYLDDESDVLDGFEFLTMAEAGEVGHWEVLEQMADTAKAADTARGADVVALVQWALPVQQRHLDVARETSARLAASEDPFEEN